ncbi:hypothetical protein SDC9_122118 [bioreactor metagenome]|uniref:Uncharacterized protein n=1 Tax=bioreactor metagenome TaxID=1076179 RepID=A0A645CDV1_9ZZZZ
MLVLIEEFLIDIIIKDNKDNPRIVTGTLCEAGIVAELRTSIPLLSNSSFKVMLFGLSVKYFVPSFKVTFIFCEALTSTVVTIKLEVSFKNSG